MFQDTSEQRLVQLVTIISVIVNLFLTSLKLVVGIIIGSTALVADGIDSLLDIITTLFAYIGVRVANIPPDDFHTYGHQKMEIFFSLGIFIIIIYSGSQIFFTAWDRLLIGYELTFDLIGLVTALLSILFKVLLSYIVLRT
ncbi:MAG: cation diffusion facilitator family transporter [Candidatus Hodarchaeales archaeon]